MEEIANLIMDYGVSIIIIVMFLYDWFNTKQDTKKTLKAIEENSKNVSACLEEMSISNNNISKSLDLLQTTLDNHTEKIDFIINRTK